MSVSSVSGNSFNPYVAPEPAATTQPTAPAAPAAPTKPAAPNSPAHVATDADAVAKHARIPGPTRSNGGAVMLPYDASAQLTQELSQELIADTPLYTANGQSDGPPTAPAATGASAGVDLKV